MSVCVFMAIAVGMVVVMSGMAVAVPVVVVTVPVMLMSVIAGVAMALGSGARRPMVMTMIVVFVAVFRAVLVLFMPMGVPAGMRMGFGGNVGRRRFAALERLIGFGHDCFLGSAMEYSKHLEVTPRSTLRTTRMQHENR